MSHHLYAPGKLGRTSGRSRVIVRVYGHRLIRNLQTQITKDEPANPRKLLINDKVLVRLPWEKRAFYVKGVVRAIGYWVKFFDGLREKRIVNLFKLRALPRQSTFVKEKMKKGADWFLGKHNTSP